MNGSMYSKGVHQPHALHPWNYSVSSFLIKHCHSNKSMHIVTLRHVRDSMLTLLSKRRSNYFNTFENYIANKYFFHYVPPRCKLVKFDSRYMIPWDIFSSLFFFCPSLLKSHDIENETLFLE